MERVQRTVEIKLTPEECEILWKAEQLLREMGKEISGITTPVYQSDKEEIAECLRVFGIFLGRSGTGSEVFNKRRRMEKSNVHGNDRSRYRF